MSTSTFVEQLYNRILGRASDAPGKAFWTAMLDSGMRSAAEVARGFVESDEFRDKVAPVTMLYYTARGAIPDATALSWMVQQHQSGASLTQLSAALVDSAEFAGVYGALDDRAFLTALYQNVFHRAPDAEGMAFWLRGLADGATRANVVQGFAASSEQFAAKGAHLHVIVSYAALLRVAPTQAQLDAALAAHDTLGLLRTLLSSDAYGGVDVPGLPPRPNPEPPIPPEPPTDPDTPTGATIAGAAFDHASGVLTIHGASFDDLGATIGTDIQGQLDWSKLVWDINADNAVTSNHGFAPGDVVSAVITSATQLTVTLSGGVLALVAMAGFGAAGGADAIDVQAGFLGPLVTTDAAANAPVTFADTTAPTVVAFSSATPDGAYCAGATIAISATMSEAVAAGSTLTVTLDTGASVVLTAGVTGTLLLGSYLVAPGHTSAALTVASFTAGTVRDAVGNLLGATALPSGAGNIGGTSAIVIDTTAPLLASSTPADDASAVGVNGDLVLTFSETVAAVTGKQIRIYASSGDTLIDTIAADDARVSVAGNVVTIDPAATLSALTAYYVLLDAGTFTDQAGNAYAGIASTSALQFTTAGSSFTAVVVGSDVVFGGSAAGPVLMTTDGTSVTFSRGGASAAPLAIADIGAGGIDAVGMSSATFATAGVANLLKDGAASVDAAGAGAPQLIALVAGADKLADGGLINATLGASAFAALVDKLASGGALSVDAAGATPGELAELLAHPGKVADGAIVNATLTMDQFDDLAAKLADGGALSVDVGAASTAELSVLAGASDKVASGGVVSASLTANQSAAELASLLGKTTDAAVLATSMTASQVAALAGGVGGVAVDGITGSLTLTASALSLGELTSLLGNAVAAGASVTVDAAAITDDQLNSVIVGSAKVDSITNLVITEALGNGGIALLLSKAVDADVNVSFMGVSQLAAVDTTHVRANGVSGVVTGMTAAELNALAGLATHIADGVLNGDVVLAHADIAAFNSLQAKLHASATVAINGVADNATAFVTGLVNASFVGTAAGTSGQFNVTAGAGVQSITTGVGNDVIDGGAGDDLLDIGSGNDRVVLGTAGVAGVDSVAGFDGADVLAFVGGGTYLASGINDSGATLSLEDVVQLASLEAKAASGVAGTSEGFAVSFVYAGSTFVYIDGDNDGFSVANDALVRLVGVNVGDLSGASFGSV